MPKMSNILICDMPLRFDTYKGCSHGCEYCFVKLKTDISKIQNGESAQTLLNFINKRRNGEVVEKIFDYDIPLHWGGVSDPFQPLELERRRSLDCLKVFAKTKYPFVISTKNAIVARPEYLELLKDCNCAVQFSAIGSSYDDFEKGASTFLERVVAMKKISEIGIRVIVRAQPMLAKMENELTENLKLFKEAGVHGLIIEFMKYKYKAVGTLKVRGDNVYPLEIIKPVFDRVKKQANALGIKVYAGENRLRQYGDSLNCCGVGDLWKTHEANLNHLLFDDKKVELKELHNNILSGGSSQPNQWSLGQSTKGLELLKTLNYKKLLNMAMQSKSSLSDYTIDKKAYEAIKNFKPY